MLIRNKIGRKSNFVIVVYVLNVFLFKSYEVNVHNAQRSEYGAFGISKLQPFKPLYILLIVLMLKINTIRQMTYIYC